MNVYKQIIRIAKDLSSFGLQPIRKKPDYGTGNDIMHQLADHAGIDLDKEQNKKSSKESKND